MTYKFVPPKTTVMNEAGNEPLSQAEHAKLATEWAAHTLNQMFFLSLDNKEVAKAICETAILIGKLNREYSDLIKEGLKKNNGRPNHSTTELDKQFLNYYAHAIMLDKSKALLNLRDYHQRMTNTLLSEVTIQNKISNALHNMQDGKFLLTDLLDWAQPIIQERIEKGAKLKKQVQK